MHRNRILLNNIDLLLLTCLLQIYKRVLSRYDLNSLLPNTCFEERLRIVSHARIRQKLCVCVFVCVRKSESERETENENKRERERGEGWKNKLPGYYIPV